MDGSFDNPPIVLHARRGKLLVALFGSLAFVAAGGLILQWGEGRTRAIVIGWMTIVVFGVFAVSIARRARRPDRLELSPEGFCYTDAAGRLLRLAWNELALVDLRRWGATSQVAITVTPAAAARMPGRALTRAFQGADAVLPTGWPLPSSALAGLIQDAKARWDR